MIYPYIYIYIYVYVCICTHTYLYSLQDGEKVRAENGLAGDREKQRSLSRENSNSPASSGSQTSVVSCYQPRLGASPLPPTASVSSLASDVPRFVVKTMARRPVPVAPSGPAHSNTRRASRIPRPLLRPACRSASLASTCISRYRVVRENSHLKVRTDY